MYTPLNRSEEKGGRKRERDKEEGRKGEDEGEEEARQMDV